MLSNPTNNQFIANKTSSRAGLTCSSPSLMMGGGPYGVTNNSLNADVNAGLGVNVIHKKEDQPVMIMMLMLLDKLMVILKLVPLLLVKSEEVTLLLPLHQKQICVVVKRKDVEKTNQENHVENQKKVDVVEKLKDHVENARNHVENQNHVKIVDVEPVEK